METGFCHVDQVGLELLPSGNPPTSASQFSFLILSSNLIVLWSERLVVMISILLHLLRSNLLPIVWSILECDVVLREMYILWMWSGEF